MAARMLTSRPGGARFARAELLVLGARALARDVLVMSNLSRRSFLAASPAVAATPSFGAIAALGDVDVAIVGAGAAGIAAARRLAAAKRRFALIEASDRIGGRCHTDTRTFGVPADR